MPSAIDFFDLSFEERLVAADILVRLEKRFSLTRLVEIFRALERGDALVDSNPLLSKLLRDERVAAAEICLFLSLEFPEESSAQRVISCLTSGQNLWHAMLLDGLIDQQAHPAREETDADEDAGENCWEEVLM